MGHARWKLGNSACVGCGSKQQKNEIRTVEDKVLYFDIECCLSENVEFVREQTSHWMCEMWMNKTEIHAARNWKIENDFDHFCLNWIHRLQQWIGNGGEKLSMDKSAFASAVNEREISSPSRLVKVVALCCRHNVQKLFRIHTHSHPLTRAHTHVISLNISACPFHNRNASMPYILEIHRHTAAPNRVHSVHPNRVFTQHKSSNAECFFLNPSTAKTITPTSRMNEKRETKKCIFCVLDFRYVFFSRLVPFFSFLKEKEEPWIRERVKRIEMVH